MPRKNRISLPGFFYHVILRGNNKEDIFLSNEDRSQLSFLLQEGLERFGHRIHAFCFMTNHIHLALQVSDVPLSKIVHNFSFRYTNYLNRRYQRVGHVFQGRFKSILLDKEGYLKELVRYIHLNPVRGGLVQEVGNFHWSSYQSYLHRNCQEFPWVTTDVVLQLFGEDCSSAVSRFVAFHQEGDEKPEEVLCRGNQEGRILGDKAFLSKIRRINERQRVSDTVPLSVLIDVVCQHFSVKVDDLSTPSRKEKVSRIRAILAILTQNHPNWTLEELGEVLKRDPSTLCSLVSRFERKVSENSSLAVELQKVKSKVQSAISKFSH